MCPLCPNANAVVALARARPWMLVESTGRVDAQAVPLVNRLLSGRESAVRLALDRAVGVTGVASLPELGFSDSA